MGIEGSAIAILAILIFVAFYGNQLQELITAQTNNLQSQQQQQLAANGLAPSAIPQSGQVVCNLQITIYPYLTASALQLIQVDESFLGQDPSVIEPNPYHTPVSYQWLSCHVYGQLTAASFIPTIPNFIHDPKLLDFVTNPSSQQIYYDIAMTGQDGKLLSKQTSGYGNYLEQSFVLPSGIVDIPFTKVLNYYVPNVVRQNYNLLITSNLPINGMPAGTPFTFGLCADISGTTAIKCQ